MKHLINKLYIAFAAGALAIGPPASAAGADAAPQDPYFDLASYEIERIADDGSSKAIMGADLHDGSAGIPALDQADLALDKIINMGRKAWAIVESNKPVANVAENVANALPEGSKTWLQLQGWENPRAATYQINYKNGYGWKVVQFAYTVVYTAGGNVGGAGRYLSQVTVLPKLVDVSWGFKFNASIQTPNTVNVGTLAAPIAGQQVDVRWSVDTVFKHIGHTQSFFIRGDGQMLELN